MRGKRRGVARRDTNDKSARCRRGSPSRPPPCLRRRADHQRPADRLVEPPKRTPTSTRAASNPASGTSWQWLGTSAPTRGSGGSASDQATTLPHPDDRRRVRYRPSLNVHLGPASRLLKLMPIGSRPRPQCAACGDPGIRVRRCPETHVRKRSSVWPSGHPGSAVPSAPDRSRRDVRITRRIKRDGRTSRASSKCRSSRLGRRGAMSEYRVRYHTVARPCGHPQSAVPPARRVRHTMSESRRR